MKNNTWIVTLIIIAINVIIFIIETLYWWSTNKEVAYNFWVMYTPIVAQQPRRLFTAMFLHFGIVHIVMNMYALYSIGPMLEKIFGKRRYLIIYLLSWLAWNLLVYRRESFTWNYSFSAWASGAIFWLLWAFLALVLFLRKESKNVDVRQVVISIIASLAPGFLLSWISLTAHLGWLFWGFIVTNIILLFRKPKRNNEQLEE